MTEFNCQISHGDSHYLPLKYMTSLSLKEVTIVRFMGHLVSIKITPKLGMTLPRRIL